MKSVSLIVTVLLCGSTSLTFASSVGVLYTQATAAERAAKLDVVVCTQL